MANRIDATQLLNFSRGIELVVNRTSDPRSLPRVTQAMISATPGQAKLDGVLRKPSHEERVLDMLRPSLPLNLLEGHAIARSMASLTSALRDAAAAGDEHAQIYRRAAAITAEEVKSRELVGAYKRALYSA